ncbi:MAG: hypothetical protein V3T62_03675, partial [Alphaproteobacteria bacterium]
SFKCDFRHTFTAKPVAHAQSWRSQVAIKKPRTSTEWNSNRLCFALWRGDIGRNLARSWIMRNIFIAISIAVFAAFLATKAEAGLVEDLRSGKSDVRA